MQRSRKQVRGKGAQEKAKKKKREGAAAPTDSPQPSQSSGPAERESQSPAASQKSNAPPLIPNQNSKNRNTVTGGGSNNTTGGIFSGFFFGAASKLGQLVGFHSAPDPKTPPAQNEKAQDELKSPRRQNVAAARSSSSADLMSPVSLPRGAGTGLLDSDIDDFPPPRAARTGISDSDRDHSQHDVVSDVHSAAGDSEFAGSSSGNEADMEAQDDEKDDDESDADSMIDDFILLDPNQPDDPIRRVFAPAAEPVSDKDLELENSRLRNIVDNMAAELESRRERLRVQAANTQNLEQANRDLTVNLVDAKEVADQEMVQKYYEILVVEDDMYADEMWNQFWEQKTMKSNLLASIEKRNKYLKLADVTVAKHKADYKLLQDQKQREISDLNEKHGAECKEAKKIILGLAAHETALGNEVVALTKVQQMLRDELESKKSELEKLIRKSELAKSEHEALLSRRISDLQLTHENLVHELRRGHRQKLSQLANDLVLGQKNHSVAVQKLQDEHDKKIKKLDGDRQADQKALEEHRKKMSQLANDLVVAQKTNSAAVQKLQNEYDQKIQKLDDDHRTVQKKLEDVGVILGKLKDDHAAVQLRNESLIQLYEEEQKASELLRAQGSNSVNLQLKIDLAEPGDRAEVQSDDDLCENDDQNLFADFHMSDDDESAGNGGISSHDIQDDSKHDGAEADAARSENAAQEVAAFVLNKICSDVVSKSTDALNAICKDVVSKSIEGAVLNALVGVTPQQQSKTRKRRTSDFELRGKRRKIESVAHSTKKRRASVPVGGASKKQKVEA